MNQRKKIYELWPSKNRFTLKGFFITGPKSDSPVTLSLYAILLLTLGLYTYFICPVMINDSLSLCLGFYVTYMTTITFMLLTNQRDPGVIPSRPFLQLQQQKIERQYNHNYLQLLTLPEYQRLIYILYQTSDPSQVFCCSCHIYRPISASHCSQCDSCYMGMDHHCPWLGTCVAKNNYWTFLAFLGSVVGLMVVLGINGLVFVDYGIGEGDNGKQATDWTIFLVVCYVVVGALLFLIVGFLVFHIMLVCKGKTTRQFIKEKKKRQHSAAIVPQQSKIKTQQQYLSQSLISSINLPNKQPEIKRTQDQILIPSQTFANSKIQQRFLDDYISSIYRQTSAFYDQLFDTRRSILLVDFRQLLIESEVKFIKDGLLEIQKRNTAMKTQGTRYEYHKRILSH